jgi:hypothetical protein
MVEKVCGPCMISFPGGMKKACYRVGSELRQFSFQLHALRVLHAISPCMGARI